MIVLDTNVLSALMRDVPESPVITWLDAQHAESIWTTAITVFEIRTGLELVGDNRRRAGLQSAFARVITEHLDHRVIAFDVPAANSAGTIVAKRQRVGRTVELRDAQIAGIALARKARLATRNTKHFQGLGIRLVDPWSA